MSSKIKKYHGHPVKSAEIREGRVPTTKWKPKVKYTWSAGVAMSRFLDELKNGKIIAIKCQTCERIIVPPRAFCEQCFKPTDQWIYVKNTGTVNTYSVSFIAGDASRIKEPIIVAIIDIDGASPGMGLLHKISEISWKEVTFGMKVEAVWKPPEERTGAITDIKYWRPVKEA